jgi:hypothetical protein
MARWQPGARERLVVAAVDLFSEQGYDATTVAQIAPGSPEAPSSGTSPTSVKCWSPGKKR